MVIATMAIVSIIIGILIGAAFYVFYSFALYRLAEKRNIDLPWLAWIPIAQMYIVGKMIKSIKISTLEIPMLEVVLPAAMLAFVLFRRITVLGFIISVVFYALLILSFYNLYRQYLPENAVAYTILSIFLIPVPFLLLKLSKMEPVNVP